MLPNIVAEKAMFEDVGELVGSTSYLHIHVDVPISKIEQRIKELQKWLHGIGNEWKNLDTIESARKANKTTRLPTVDYADYNKFVSVRHMIGAAWAEIGRLSFRSTLRLQQRVNALKGVFPNYSRNQTIPASRLTREAEEEWSRTNLFVAYDVIPVVGPVEENQEKGRNRTKRALRKKRFAGLVALPLAASASFMAMYNGQQISYLQTELTRNSQNIKKLFDVVVGIDELLSTVAQQLVTLLDDFMSLLMNNPAVLAVKLQELVGEIDHHLEQAVHAIQGGLLHRLSPDLIPVDVLHQLFQSLTLRAQEYKSELLVERASDLFQIETSLLFDGNNAHLLIHVPMSPRRSRLRLYKLHPFPVTVDGGYVMTLDVREEILALSNTDHRYSLELRQVDLLSCLRFNRQYLCDGFGVLSRRFDKSCLGSIYKQDFDNARRVCNYEIVEAEERVVQMGKRTFAAYLPVARTVPVTCLNGTISEKYLSKGANVFSLDDGCEAEFVQHIAYADLAVEFPDSMIQFHYDWEPLEMIPISPGDIPKAIQRLADLNIKRPYLKDLQFLAMSTQESLKSLTSHGQPMVFIVVTFVITLVILILICQCVYRRRRRQRRMPPPARAPEPDYVEMQTLHAPERQQQRSETQNDVNQAIDRMRDRLQSLKRN